jgi:nitrate reductase NapE
MPHAGSQLARARRDATRIAANGQTRMRNEAERYRAAGDATSERTRELRSFLFLTVVMMPVLSVIIVGGYGFLVWMYQILAGPPSG